jgi:hypothetical protein
MQNHAGQRHMKFRVVRTVGSLFGNEGADPKGVEKQVIHH